MEKAKIFQNGRSQAVRLPKKYRFEEDEVYIKHVGNVVLLIPKSDPWHNLFMGLEMFSDGLTLTRDQPKLETREPIH